MEESFNTWARESSGTPAFSYGVRNSGSSSLTPTRSQRGFSLTTFTLSKACEWLPPRNAMRVRSIALMLAQPRTGIGIENQAGCLALFPREGGVWPNLTLYTETARRGFFDH